MTGLDWINSGKPDGGAIQVGEMNPASIMSYNRDIRKLQPSDKDGSKKFYALPNGWVEPLNRKVAIKDFAPVLMKRN
jgi:hypothetical protein